MNKYKDILFFDTETTGLPPRNATWSECFKDYPHIVQIAWIFGDIEECHIIRPEGWEIPEESVKIHGITMETAMERGERFASVIGRFLDLARKARYICGHNVTFDTSMVKANVRREMNLEQYERSGFEGALHPSKRIDTMTSCTQWVGAIGKSGKVKYPKLIELYDRCFPGETFPAHDALDDTRAVVRCFPVIVAEGLVTLTDPERGDVKETPEKGPNFASGKTDERLPVRAEKAPQNRNFEKITASVEELLEQDNF